MAEKNISSGERVLRFALGIFLLFLAMKKVALLPTWAFGLAMIISLALIITSVFGHDPLYKKLSFMKCEVCEKEEKKEKEKKKKKK